MKKKAIIISIKGYKLSKKERSLFIKDKPWGLILFKRNIKTFYQTKKLIEDVKRLTKTPKFPILIDEEGSTVTRLNRIFDNYFSQKFFGDIYTNNKNIGLKYYQDYTKSVIFFLKNSLPLYLQ